MLKVNQTKVNLKVSCYLVLSFVGSFLVITKFHPTGNQQIKLQSCFDNANKQIDPKLDPKEALREQHGFAASGEPLTGPSC